METVKKKSLTFSVWDVGGQDQVNFSYLYFDYFFYEQSDKYPLFCNSRF